MLELHTLGGLWLCRTGDGDPRPIVLQSKRLVLLAYLAASLAHTLRRRDSLLALFWPELDQEHARGALRQALHALRSSLGEGVILCRGESEVGIDPFLLRADVQTLQAAIEAGNPREVLALFRGDFLEGVFVTECSVELDEWIAGERDRLRGLVARAAWEVAEAPGEREGVGAVVRRAVRLSGDDEGALRRGILLLDRVGDYAGAIAIYEAFALRVVRDLGVEPSAETRGCIEAIRERRVAKDARSQIMASSPGKRMNPVLAQAGPVLPDLGDVDPRTSYLLGMHYGVLGTAAHFRGAIDQLERAIVGDDTFAPAYAGLGYVLTMAVDYAVLPATEAYRRAAPVIVRALALDPSLPLAHLAQARLLQLRDWDWQGAEAAYRRAISLQPDARTFLTYGWFLEWYLGRAAEGVAASERAVELEPASAVLHVALAWRLRGAGELDRAIAESRLALALDAAAADSYWVQAEVHLRREEWALAEQNARDYIAAAGADLPANRSTLGEILARTGRTAEARAYAARLALLAPRDGPSLVALARMEMALGDHGRALELLEHAVRERVFTIPFQPYWDPIRSHPRFGAAVRAQGL